MAIYIVQKESLETVADSIRAKAGISEKLVFPDGWKAAVDGIEGGGLAPNERIYQVGNGVGSLSLGGCFASNANGAVQEG